MTITTSFALRHAGAASGYPVPTWVGYLPPSYRHEWAPCRKIVSPKPKRVPVSDNCCNHFENPYPLHLHPSGRPGSGDDPPSSTTVTTLSESETRKTEQRVQENQWSDPVRLAPPLTGLNLSSKRPLLSHGHPHQHRVRGACPQHKPTPNPLPLPEDALRGMVKAELPPTPLDGLTIFRVRNQLEVFPHPGGSPTSREVPLTSCPHWSLLTLREVFMSRHSSREE